MAARRVVDASVIAAVAFNEPSAREATLMLKGKDLYAPELLPYELCNVARRKTLEHPDNAPAIADALNVALEASMTLVRVPANELLPLAIAARLSAYDAAYLYLSRLLGCPLVSFDTRLARLARAQRRP
jgi:predicted nucleic acid-binding protein